MAIKKFVNPSLGPRHVGLITTVHPPTRQIEAKLKDGGEVMVSLFDVPTFFVWPNVGEYWIIRQDGGYWKLENKFDPAGDDHKIEHLAPGEAKIPAETLKTPSGKQVVTVASDENPLIVNADNTVEMAGVKVIVGTGEPEGIISAPIGSLFTRTDGISGSTLYVKTSGTESTGWNAVG